MIIARCRLRIPQECLHRRMEPRSGLAPALHPPVPRLVPQPCAPAWTQSSEPWINRHRRRYFWPGNVVRGCPDQADRHPVLEPVVPIAT